MAFDIRHSTFAIPVTRMFLSRDEVRSLDDRASAEYGLPGIVLMENAGRGTAELLLRLGIGGPVVICCGRGNNGGDGFVIARHLDNHHVPVRVLVFAREADLRGDAAVNHGVLARSDVPIVHAPLATLAEELAAGNWVVDALFGTGLTGAVRPPFDHVIAAINGCPARILAVDIPSGLDCDTGLPLGPTIKAHHTATMVAQKKGFVQPGARDWLGDVHVIDIGLPRKMLG
jgi:NAD(P)H-hydrate epimerase